MKTASRILATVVFAILAFLAASPFGAALSRVVPGPIFLFVVCAITALLCLSAPTGRWAWGRGALLVGALFFGMPLSMIALTGQAWNEVVTNAPQGQAAATAVGATLGATALMGASMFAGFLLGAIFLIAGLALTLGGRREVTVNDRVATVGT